MTAIKFISTDYSLLVIDTYPGLPPLAEVTGIMIQGNIPGHGRQGTYQRMIFEEEAALTERIDSLYTPSLKSIGKRARFSSLRDLALMLFLASLGVGLL